MTKGVQDLMFEVLRIRDALHNAIYSTGDVDAAVALVTDDFTLTNVPAGTGASGPAELRRYLTEDVLPALPADLEFCRATRTGDRWRVAQEDLVRFTHDRELPWLLPGVAPTGRRAEFLAVSVVTVQRSSVLSYRTLWDQMTLVHQLGIDPAQVLPGRAARV